MGGNLPVKSDKTLTGDGYFFRTRQSVPGEVSGVFE
jgi:hypothetical protein